jgi:hypothetical protein
MMLVKSDCQILLKKLIKLLIVYIIICITGHYKWWFIVTLYSTQSQPDIGRQSRLSEYYILLCDKPE